MNNMTFSKSKSNNIDKLPLNIPQYFFDDAWIDHHERVTRSWMQAKIHPEPVLKPEKPWEGRCIALFGTVLQRPDDEYRMYYTNWINSTQDVLLAVSRDGIFWEKRDVGIAEWNGNRDNNIVFLRQELIENADSPSIIYDKDDEQFPYKMIMSEFADFDTGKNTEKKWCLAGYKSRDGLSWEKYSGIRMAAGDRTNLMPEKFNNKYEIYTRGSNMIDTYGKRVIYRSESEDFINWTTPEMVLAPDRGR